MSKQKADLLQGTLDLLILKALSLGPMHGYGVGQRIMQMAEEMLKIEEGSLYPALYRLEEKEWIKSEWGISENNRRARFYKLTPAGRKQLNIEEENWQRFALAMGKVLRTA
ncbi:MAG: PadR family transcriptional regulator [Chloracidobacterium sp.]|nr:PadR family transcriptional regulator [Chloracidobacterium sp.]